MTPKPCPPRPRGARLQGWTFTAHALERMGQMGVSGQEILAVLERPDIDYPQMGQYAGKRIAGRGLLATCYNPVDKVVVTVFPWTIETYDRADGRGGRTSPALRAT